MAIHRGTSKMKHSNGPVLQDQRKRVGGIERHIDDSINREYFIVYDAKGNPKTFLHAVDATEAIERGIFFKQKPKKQETNNESTT